MPAQTTSDGMNFNWSRSFSGNAEQVSAQLDRVQDMPKHEKELVIARMAMFTTDVVSFSVIASGMLTDSTSSTHIDVYVQRHSQR